MTVLLSKPASFVFDVTDRFDSTDTNYDFGTILPGTSKTVPAMFHNPTAHDITFSVVMQGTFPVGGTISADKSVVHAGENLLVMLTLSMAADAVGVGPYSVNVQAIS